MEESISRVLKCNEDHLRLESTGHPVPFATPGEPFSRVLASHSEGGVVHWRMANLPGPIWF